MKDATNWDDALSSYRSGNYSKALPQLQSLAQRGDVRAQTLLGDMYVYGQGFLKMLPRLVNIMGPLPKPMSPTRRTCSVTC
jgi:TPR repeat protein